MNNISSEPQGPGNPGNVSGKPTQVEGYEHTYGTAKTPEQEAAWKKFGDTCNQKLSQFTSDVSKVSLKTEAGEGYNVQRLILKDPIPSSGEVSYFVIEKVLPTAGLPDADFVNSIHITKASHMSREFWIEEGYRFDRDGVLRRIVGDTIVPETVMQLTDNIDYAKSVSTTQTVSSQTNMLTERIARSTPSELPTSFKLTGRLSDEETDRLTQEEDEEWFETQRKHFRQQKEGKDVNGVNEEPWRKELQDKAIEIAKNDGRNHPEEADFNTATIFLGDKIPKSVRDDLQEDLRAVEEGRSSRNQ